jgi:hypothetical protein
MKLSFDDEESFKEAVGSLRFNNPPSDPDTRQLGVESRSTVPFQDQDQERNENICFINPTSDPSLRQMGSSSSMSPLERSEDNVEMLRRSHSL